MNNNIEEILNKEFSFYNKLDEEEKQDFWSRLSDVRKNLILKEDLEKNGFGKNKIKLTEYNYSFFDLSIEKTLYDVYYKEFLFQKSENTTNDEEYKYYLSQVFFRMIYNNKFYQGFLYSLNYFVYEEIEEILSDFIDNIFNTELNFDFIKQENTIYSTLSLNHKYYFNQEKIEKFEKWFLEHKEKMFNNFKLDEENKFKNKCFIDIKRNFENEEIIKIIFSGEEILKKINFENFMDNVEENSGSFLLIENYIKEFVEKEKKVILDKIKEIFI